MPAVGRETERQTGGQEYRQASRNAKKTDG
jgi:hypothetical protein